MSRRAANLALRERENNIRLERANKLRAEREAVRAGIDESVRVANDQGVHVEIAKNGRVDTSRDGFKWLCGSVKRKPKLSPPQILAGERYRTDYDSVRIVRVTSAYEETTNSYADPVECEIRRRERADALALANGVLLSAHRTLLYVVEGVIAEGRTIAELTSLTGEEDAAVLKTLHLALDILAGHYGYYSAR